MSHGLQTDTKISVQQLHELRSKNVHIIGAASAEGIAVLRYLDKHGFTQVTMHDQRPQGELLKAFRTTHGAYSRREQDTLWKSIKPIIAAGRYDDDYLAGVEAADLVVLGQGWYLDADNRRRLNEAVPDSAVVTSMTELYYALFEGPVIGVTGTNGKSTTVALIEHILAACKVPHVVAGNERSSKQFLPYLDDVEPNTWAVLETSNRQLLQTQRAPHVAVLTSLTPDHLEEHDGWQGYVATKARMFRHQHEHDVAIVNGDDAHALAVARLSPASAANRLVICGIQSDESPVDIHDDSPFVQWKNDTLIAHRVPRWSDSGEPNTDAYEVSGVLAEAHDLTVIGAHNRRNVAVACAVALAAGAEVTRIAPALRSFAGKSLRLQLLETVAGVEVWSDIKSTTPQSTIAAVSALREHKPNAAIYAVIGGSDKGLDYSPLVEQLAAARVRVLLVPGSATDKVRQLLRDRDYSFRDFEELSDGLEFAMTTASEGDCVIVSPAAAGFWTTQLQGKASLRALVQRYATAL